MITLSYTHKIRDDLHTAFTIDYSEIFTKSAAGPGVKKLSPVQVATGSGLQRTEHQGSSPSATLRKSSVTASAAPSSRLK